MIEFPGTEQYIQQYERFLAVTRKAGASAELDALRDRAKAHVERLSSAVAIGFAGEFGAGKSSLANMLAGADILPTGPQHLQLPLVIVNYSDEPQTTVGWWKKPQKIYAGVALEKAAVDEPDFISVGLPSPALREISLFDLPGSGALDDTYKQTLELLNLVDCAIWCTNGTNAWRETERHLWSQVPAELRENSLLAVTHSDLPPVRDAIDRVLARLEKENKGMFDAIVPIGTPIAVQAMSQEPEPNFDLWESCGGQALAEEVLRVASVRRQRDIDAARKDWQSLFLPALEQIEAAAKPVEPAVPYDSGDALQDSIAATLPPLSNPILEEWLTGVARIYDDLRATSDIDPATFLQSCQEIVEEFAERLENGSEIDPAADWIPAEFEKATDLLLLLQFETGNAPLRDAVSILAQLSDNLAWAGSSVVESQTRTGT
ncbi:dynamin family protein [Ruegeria sp. HKCCD8929]|uniref:dynamin family protein n=1 Tax=Ruegeria sp. HKCCD8929 TaxID=2683006 RepID=UPI001487BEB0